MSFFLSFRYNIVPKKHNLNLINLDGMKFNIFKDEWSLSSDKSINYIGKFVKD